MLNALESVFLVFNVVHVFACNDLSFLHGFYCVFMLGVLLKPPIAHVTKSTFDFYTLLLNLPSPRDNPKKTSSGLTLSNG